MVDVGREFEEAHAGCLPQPKEQVPLLPVPSAPLLVEEVKPVDPPLRIDGWGPMDPQE